jgi:hypothetical protein
MRTGFGFIIRYQTRYKISVNKYFFKIEFSGAFKETA